MASVTANIGNDHYTTTIHSTGGHYVTADEPTDKGGANKGFTASELLASALGACTCITLRMYADRKGWPLERIEAFIDFTRDSARNESHITRSVVLHGPLDEVQRERLLQIANQCPIHKTLSNPIHIDTRLTDALPQNGL